MPHSPAYDRLLRVSTGPISADPSGTEECDELLRRFGERGRELRSLLDSRNGFFAYESCLLVRPIGKDLHPRSLTQWNAPELWLDGYSLDTPVLFFAEDVFGGQFVIRHEVIQKFDVETGEFEPFVTTVPEWVERVLENHEEETGYPLGHAWQSQNGPIPVGQRLCPRVPFVCGGEFTVENFVALDEVRGMLFHADLAKQIRDCPDGTRIQFRITD
jgi:hypothetical protein